jgi:lambda family phage minor tail protein L
MKDITYEFTLQKNKQEQTPAIVLFTIHNYDGLSNDLRYTSYDSDVTFDGLTYSKYPIDFSNLGENSSGEVDAVRITVGNVLRYIESQLHTYDLREKKVTIRVVWEDLLSDPNSYLDFVYYIDSYSANQSQVEFICTTKLDVIDKTIPGEIYLRTHCRYRQFKGPQCGYSGSETECNRTMQRCLELNNLSRFGGFPSCPLRSLYVV